MWRVYLFEFIVVVLISVTWVNIIDKHKKTMKVVKNLFGMALLIGFINPIFFTDNQQWFQGFAGLLASFVGSGLIFGFSGYAVGPKKIGNADATPVINQVWMMFFIGAVANLLFATLYV